MIVVAGGQYDENIVLSELISRMFQATKCFDDSFFETSGAMKFGRQGVLRRISHGDLQPTHAIGIVVAVPIAMT